MVEGSIVPSALLTLTGVPIEVVVVVVGDAEDTCSDSDAPEAAVGIGSAKLPGTLKLALLLTPTLLLLLLTTSRPCS